RSAPPGPRRQCRATVARRSGARCSGRGRTRTAGAGDRGAPPRATESRAGRREALRSPRRRWRRWPRARRLPRRQVQAGLRRGKRGCVPSPEWSTISVAGRDRRSLLALREPVLDQLADRAERLVPAVVRPVGDLDARVGVVAVRVLAAARRADGLAAA